LTNQTFNKQEGNLKDRQIKFLEGLNIDLKEL